MGLGVGVVRAGWNLPEAVGTPGRWLCPLSSLAHPCTFFTAAVSTLLPLRPPSPPPPFVEDDFTSRSAARTKPLVYTDSKWPGSLAVPSGLMCVCVCVCVCVCARMHTQFCPNLCDPVDRSPPGSSTHGFSRQEYWSGSALLQ